MAIFNRLKYSSALTVLYIICFPGYSGVYGTGIVSLPQGDVQGALRYATGASEPVHEFLSIPYAKPPVGNLRLSSPQPHPGWQGTLDATKLGFLCIQDLSDPLVQLLNLSPDQFSEDCLTLNIYTPSLTGSRPVLVFLHGGGLVIGAAATCNGTALSAYEDMVIVTPAYRVGALGFLTTADGRIPPNLGMQDQQAALRWVRDYISYFGGDPTRVTIFGESAGSWSISFHLLSPESKPLFHRAIHMSGSLFNYQVINTNPQATADEVTQNLNCSSTIDVVSCLREQPAYNFVAAQAMSRWSVSQDQPNIPCDPLQMFSSGSFNRVPSLFFLMSHEGVDFVPPFILDAVELKRDDFKEIVRYFMSVYAVNNETKREQAIDIIADYYLGSHTDTPGDKDFYASKISDAIGDLWFTMPMVQNVRQYYKFASAYFAVFSRLLANSPWPSWVTGATHSGAVPYILGRDLLEVNLVDYPPDIHFNDVEKKLSRDLMRYVGNFVRGGNPNDGQLPVWPLYIQPSELHMDFDTMTSVKRGFQPDNGQFLWNTVGKMIDSVWCNNRALQIRSQVPGCRGTQEFVHKPLGRLLKTFTRWN